MSQNNANVPRLYNEYIVYDTVQNNSLVYITSDGSYKEIIADRGLLVKDVNDSIPSFQSYNGILYYSNDQLSSSDELTANNILFVNNVSRLEQITTSVNENNNEINEGVLTTYEFNYNEVIQDNTIPKFSSQFVLNNAEVIDGNQRIQNPYLIYGKGIKNGGLSFINASDDTYNFISVDNTNGVMQMSNINDVFNDLGSVDTNTSFKIVAIDNNNEVSLITKDTINEGNYVLCNKNNNLQFKELADAFGTVTPSELELNTEQYFDYTQDDLIARNVNDVFVVAQHSNNILDYPYFTGENGEYWKDLSTQPFLTISNTSTVNNVINKFYPVVVNNTDDKIYTVNNLEPAYYVLNAKNSPYNYTNLLDISDSYISGGNLDISNYNIGTSLGTGTLFNLANVLCLSNSTIFQNKGNVNTSGVLQINNSKNVTVNNTIIPNITNLQSTTDTHTERIRDLNTASDTFAIQITNLSNAKCVITNKTSAINISDILTNDSSDPTKIIRGNTIYTSGVMYLDNSKNIQTTPPSTTDQTLIYTSNGYSWSQVGTNQLANDAVTTAKIADYAVGTAQLATSAVTSNKIVDSAVTGSKLNFDGLQPSRSWNNILINNSNQLIKTTAEVINYGVFTDAGKVVNLDATVLNNVGLKFFTPTDNDGNIDESSYFATKFILYTSNNGNIDYKCSYYSFANYSNITTFTKNILCNYSYEQNKDVIDNTLNNTLNTTYNILYTTIQDNYNSNNYIKINTSIYVNTATFINTSNTTNYNNNIGYQFILENLKNLKLVVGVYSNLYTYNSLKKYYDIIYINSNLYRLDPTISGGINDMLLGYIILDLNNFVNDNNSYVANINKQYDFESYININNTTLTTLSSFNNYTPQNILTFRPLYYIDNQNNTSSLFYYKVSDNEVNNFIENFSYDSISYYDYDSTCNYNAVVGVKIGDISISNNNVFLRKSDGMLALSKNIFNYSDNDDQYIIKYGRDNTIYNNSTNTYANGSTIITTDGNYIYINLFINKPFESNLIFNISPVSSYTHIKYTSDNSNFEKLTNPKFIFSLFNLTLTVTDYVGQYPSIIQ